MLNDPEDDEITDEEEEELRRLYPTTKQEKRERIRDRVRATRQYYRELDARRREEEQ